MATYPILYADKYGPYGAGGTTPTPTKLLAPANLRQTAATESSNTLTWDPREGADSYQLRRGSTVVYSGTTTSFTDAGLPAATGYGYTVRAIGSGSYSSSDYSASFTATTLDSSTPTNPGTFALDANLLGTTYLPHDVSMLNCLADSAITVKSYKWEQLSGPVVATLTNPTYRFTAALGMTQVGTYVFKLTVTASDNTFVSRQVSTTKYADPGLAGLTPVVLFEFTGQSNVNEPSEVDALYPGGDYGDVQPPLTRAFQRFLEWDDDADGGAGNMLPMQVGPAKLPDGSDNGFDARVGLAQRWEQEHPNETAYFLSSAVGSSSYGVWSDVYGSNYLDVLYGQKHNRAVYWLRQRGFYPVYYHFNWQGEADYMQPQVIYPLLDMKVHRLREQYIFNATKIMVAGLMPGNGYDAANAELERWVNDQNRPTVGFLNNALTPYRRKDRIHAGPGGNLDIGANKLYNFFFDTTGGIAFPPQSYNQQTDTGPGPTDVVAQLSITPNPLTAAGQTTYQTTKLSGTRTIASVSYFEVINGVETPVGAGASTAPFQLVRSFDTNRNTSYAVFARGKDNLGADFQSASVTQQIQTGAGALPGGHANYAHFAAAGLHIQGGGGLTLAFWMRKAPQAAVAYLLDNRQGSSGYLLSGEKSGISAWVNGVDLSGPSSTSLAPFFTGDWVRVILEAQDPTGFPAAIFFSRFSESEYATDVDIADLRTYADALSATEKAKATGPFPDAGVTAYFTFTASSVINGRQTFLPGPLSPNESISLGVYGTTGTLHTDG